MPYHIGTEGSHDCSGFPVVKDSDGTVMGCHKTKEDAKKQLSALYVNEPIDKADDTDYESINVGGEGSEPSDTDLYNRVKAEARQKFDVYPSAVANAWVVREYKKRGGTYRKKENKKKDKSNMSEMTNIYADILKMDDNGDGTLTVYGKATDSGLDIDQQICDPVWLDTAMPEWFKTGGNIREQHSNIAAGVAKEYESKADGHYISALVVDPVSVKKVQNRVLRGFSIGIKSPRVVRDTKAANGRIIDGQIVEVSLVDRPANPSCQLVLAKSINGEKTLTKVEELLETNIEKNVAEDAMAMGGTAKAIPSREEMLSRLEGAKKALDDITAECKSYGYMMAKEYGESAEEESVEGPAGSGAEHELGEVKKEMVDQDDDEIDLAATPSTHKCLQCGCNIPQATHGLTQVEVTGGTPNNEVANVSTATIFTPDQTPKSANPTENSVEETSTDKSLLADVDISDIVEKAVKSAMKSVEAEVALLKSAKEAVENKAISLETELATAKSLAIGGGPKRTTIATGANKTNEWKAKADLYYAKASSTTDQILAKGYRDMAKDFLAKLDAETESK